MKDRYQVSGNPPLREDDSFKMCICTLLIFLALLAMISVALFMKSAPDKGPDKYNKITDGSQKDRWGGKVDQTPTPYRIIEKLTTESFTTEKQSESTISTTSTPKSIGKLLEIQSTSVKTETEYSTSLSSTSTSTTTGEPLAMSSLENKNDSITSTSTYTTEKPFITESLTETENETLTSPTSTSKTESSLNTQTLVIDSETTMSERFTEAITNEGDGLIGNSFSNFIENETTSTDFETTVTEISVEVVHSTEGETGTDNTTDSEETVNRNIQETTTEYSEESISDRAKSIPESDDLRLNTTTENSVEESTETMRPDELGQTSEKLSSEEFTTEATQTTLDKEGTSESDTMEVTTLVETSTAENLLLANTTASTSTSCPVCPTYTNASTSTSCPTCPTCTTAATTITSESTTLKPTENVCQTRQCHAVASRLLSLVDVSVDPCDDFYSYACGGIADNPTLLEEDPFEDVWNKIHKAVKSVSTLSPTSYQWFQNYYDGCVNYDKLVLEEQRKQEGRRLLSSVGSFLEHSDHIADGAVFNILFAHLNLGSWPLFSVWLDVDPVNSSQFQVVVGPPQSLGSHPLDVGEQQSENCRYMANGTTPTNLDDAWNAYKNCKKNISNYIDTTAEALNYFGVFEDKGKENETKLIEEVCSSVRGVLNLLQQNYSNPGLIKHKIETKSRDVPYFKQVTRMDLEREIPVISWSSLLFELLSTDVQDSEYIQVYFYDEIKNVFTRLENEFGEGRKVINSLLAMLAHDLYVRVALTQQSCERERYCLRVASELMPLTASNLYLGQFTTKQSTQLRDQARQVYGELVHEMTVNLDLVDWLDNSSRGMLLEKLNSSRLELPSPVDDSVLDASMAQCNITKNYMNDTICLLNQFQRNSFSRYSLLPLSTIWPHFLTAFSTETKFIYALNTFVVPLAAIAPVYDTQMPRHVVLARLGNVLARGVGHNFDTTGVRFKADGWLGKLLSEQSSPSFRFAVRTSNEQYQYQKSQQEGGVTYTYSLKAEMTLDQRLSDVTAANLSLSLLSAAVSDYTLPWMPFTPNQVYFLALAQTFCSKKKMPELFPSLYEDTSLIPYVRVSNLASNSEQFSLAFKCKIGSNMNGAIKASPFPFYEVTDYPEFYTYY